MKSPAARMAEFVEYHITGDGECNNVVLKEWAKRHGLSLQERYELAFCFAMTYCVESAIAVFTRKKNTPEPEIDWRNEILPTIILQSDRKWMRWRNRFEKCMAHFYTNASDVNSFIRDTAEGCTIPIEKGLATVTKWPEFARFATFLFLETFCALTEYEITGAQIDWAHGDTATSGLLNVFGFDEFANEFDKTNKLPPAATKERMDGMLLEIVADIAKRGGSTSVVEIETSLCAYRKLYKATRYNGYYLDRMLGELFDMEKDYPELTAELFEIRSAVFDRKLLGEFNGWRGIRPALKKQYIKTGVI